MYRSNMASLLKTVATGILVVVLLAALIAGIVMGNTFAISSYYSYSYSRSFNWGVFFGVFIGGSFSSFVLFLIMYGIGEAIEISTAAYNKIDALEKQLKKSTSGSSLSSPTSYTSNSSASYSNSSSARLNLNRASGDWRCPECQKINRSISTICSCGYEKH